MPASALERVKDVPGVAAAEGSITDATATILDKRGKAIKTGGAPQQIASTSGVEALNPFRFPEGRQPNAPGEVALDESTADRKSFDLGDTVKVQGAGGVQDLKLVGKLTLGGSGAIGGLSIALVTLPEAQRLTGHEGRFDDISVVAEKGVTPESLRDRIAKALGPRYEVRTGKQEQEDTASDVQEGLSILQSVLGAFAGIALFVGGFLIFNTFSITVAQRMRELALLRTLGASKAQVMRSVLLEGLLIGIAGSLVGLALGSLVALGLKALLASSGIEMPGTGLVLQSRTVIVSLLVGVGITTASALFPALRATRVPPIAALQEGAVLPRARGARIITPLALLLLLAGFLLVVVGLGTDDQNSALVACGSGAALAFIGLGFLSPKLVPPLARAIGAPLRGLGITGRLARENTMRQPGRTAITASALMIGVALVTFAMILTSSFKATLADAVETNLLGQAVVQDGGDTFQAFSGDTVTAIKKDPAVAVVSGVSQAEALVPQIQDTASVSGIDPRRFPQLFKLDIAKGPDNALSMLRPGRVVVDDGWATDHGIGIGDQVGLITATSKRFTARVIATKKETTGLTGDIVLDEATLRRQFDVDRFIFVMIRYRGGVDADVATKRISDRFKTLYPRLKVQTDQQFQDDQEEQVNQFLAIIFALLALSIIVAVFGIINTLVLAITERTRELGLLRAIGTTRRQVRSMVGWESVITALIGTLLGIAMGIAIGLILSQPFGDDLALSIPWGQLVIVVILGGFVGVFAAIWPARRASRLDVLESLSYE